MSETKIPFKVKLMRQSFRVLGVLAPPLAAVWAYRIWFSTRRYRESAHDRRWRQQARLQMLDHACGRIAVYRWGEPEQPVVMCLHGWNGRASQFATMLPTLLKAGYQVVAFDAPGHGQSEGQSSNLLRMAAVLQTVLQQHAPVKAMITHSFGGMVVAYAIKHLAIELERLVMIASPVSNHYLIDMYADSLGISHRVMRHFYRRLRREFGEDIFERTSAEQNLKNSKLPILLIHDKQDKAVSWRNSERIVEAAENATAIYTEGHGHRRALRDKKLIKKIVGFIKSGVVSA